MRNVLAAVRLPPGHRAGAPTLYAAWLRVWPAHQAPGVLWQVRQASGVEGDVRPSDWFMVKIGSALSMGQVRNSLHSTRGPPAAAGRPTLAQLCGAAQWIPVSLAQPPLWSTVARAQVLIWSVRAPFRTRGMMTGRLPQRFRLRSLGESCGPFHHVLNRWHLLQAFTVSLFLVLGAAVERVIVVRVQPCVDCCMARTASRTDPRQRQHSISHPPMAVAGLDRLAGSRLRGLRRHLRVHLGGRVRARAHAAEGLPRVARGAGPDGRGVGGLHRVCQGFARPLARRAPGRGVLSARFARNAGAPCD